MKRFSLIALVLVLILVSGMCLAAKPVLRVGTDATYAPFETVDKDGKYVGFDMELIRMVATEAGMDLKLNNINWDGIIPGLVNGNYDCIISAMTITAERKKQINFSDPYFQIKQVIVVKSDNKTVKGIADLAGKAVAVQNGTTGDLYATKNIKNVQMKRFTANPEAVQDLLNNASYAAVMDDLVAIKAISANPGLKMIDIKEAEVENYGIAVKKGNEALLQKINKALQTLKKNGKLDALIKKYKSAK